MTHRDEVFSRIIGRVDVARFADKFVVVVGAGSVGSLVATELVRCGVGHIALIDGDNFEPQNLPRHALDSRYLWANKAEAMADMLSGVPGLDAGALNRFIDERMSDLDLDALLHPADLIVLATDERVVQRRVAERALALDIPAVIPTLYRDPGAGEVFVQLGSDHPCYFCWDAFRPANETARGISSLNADALAVIQRTVYLCLGVLDLSSPEARDMAPTEDDPRLRQLFVLRPGSNLVRAPLDRRGDCASCRVGPSSLNDHPRRARRRSDVAAFMLAAERPSASDWSFVIGTSTPPLIDSVSVSERVVLQGTPVTVSWVARDATHVHIDGDKALPVQGSVELVVTQPRAFTVTAVSPLGRVSASTSVVRTIPLPQMPSVTVGRLAATGPVVRGVDRPLLSPVPFPPFTRGTSPVRPVSFLHPTLSALRRH